MAFANSWMTWQVLSSDPLALRALLGGEDRAVSLFEQAADWLLAHKVLLRGVTRDSCAAIETLPIHTPDHVRQMSLNARTKLAPRTFSATRSG
jgi:hypothetical protein